MPTLDVKVNGRDHRVEVEIDSTLLEVLRDNLLITGPKAGCNTGDCGVCSVLLDDQAGGQLATRHLLQTGHQAIGYLSGPEVSHSGRLRARGYRAALASARLPYYADWVRPCAPVVEGGHEAARDLLQAHPELTALFCYNDLVAVGALHACTELGLSVPHDVAVIGHDGIPLSAWVTPPLTTCLVPRYDLGGQAVRLLLEQIEEGSKDGGQEVVLRAELVVRASAPCREQEEKA